ncbi:MAG TPA: AAA family ATPase [Candidatus Methanoperedenaceae archaeon]|nr:AAA family ATPase [Candidatus Methanoperedenaceae archaeon]
MLIQRVELRNVKSYKQETIEFREGVNGISGENGHGKTTILEAIGFALFDSLPYKESDFLRRGEKSGLVAVDVISNDGKPYRITRKMGTSSEYSARGNGLHITGKKDVIDWIIDNLVPGVSGGDELRKVFENAVGVPQGLFTAAFQEIPSKRKKTFDEMLRVDEYRMAYENLLEPAKLIDAKIEGLEKEIGELKIRAESYDRKKSERDALSIKITELRKNLEESSRKLSKEKAVRDSLKKRKQDMALIEGECRRIEERITGLSRQLRTAEAELAKSDASAQIVSQLAPDKEAYEKARARLDAFEAGRKERDSIRERLAGAEKELALLGERRTRIAKLTNDIQKNEDEMKALGTGMAEQAKLGAQILEKKAEQAAVRKELSDIKARMGEAGTSNLCPVMKGVRCGSVSDFSAYFRERLREEEAKSKEVDAALRELDARLHALSDPAGRAKMLDALIAQWREEIGRLKKQLESFPEKELAAAGLRAGLEKFSSLDLDITDTRKKMSALEPNYKRHLQNQPAAARMAEHRDECERLSGLIADETAKLGDKHGALSEIRSSFSEEALARAERACEELGAAVSSTGSLVSEKERQKQILDSEISVMDGYLAKIKDLESERDRENRFVEYAGFLRETVKNAAAYVALEYVTEIGAQAGSLFCSIMDDFSQELRWGEDYGITVTEGGQEKNFYQLSGGEKMGAALAVRLALLKILANSDIVFLDEPTANMDDIRRENLSGQILGIRGFSQVFVISHDDTFNERYGHVIRVEKSGGVSRVVRGGMVQAALEK